MAPRRSAEGFALPLLLGLIGLLAVLGVALQQSRAAIDAARDQQTGRALREARDALLAYAVQRHYVSGQSPGFRPGELPCPDGDNDGDDDGLCTAGAIGRVPWKSLGISPPVDGSGEVIWYTLSGNFQRPPQNPNPINSLTRGDLRVLGDDGVTVEADDAVFVLFAPGAVLKGQSRAASVSEACPYGSSKPQDQCPDNYLDAHAGIANAVKNGPFIAAVPRDDFNDRLLVMRTREFMRQVERRVGLEARSWLEGYRAAYGRYPYPAPAGEAACTDGNPGTACTSSETACSGHFPEDALTASTLDWPADVYYYQDYRANPAWPPVAARTAWFRANGWTAVTAYAIDGCAAPLTVDAAPAPALLLLPGTPAGAVSSPPTLAELLEDAANQDAWTDGAPGQLQFVTPSESANDQLFASP